MKPRIRPELSVVMNAKNVRPYLRAAIRSVLGQRGVELELVLVEHGSSDGSASIVDDVVRAQPGRIVAVREPDAGPAEGWHNGAVAASADCIYFLNGDDFLPSPLALKHALRAHRAAENPAVLVANGFGCEADASDYWPEIAGVPSLTGFLQETGVFFQQGSLWRRDALLERQLLVVSNRMCWDGEAYLRVLASGDLRVATARVHVGCFRQVPTGISATTHSASLAGWFEDRRREHSVDRVVLPRIAKHLRDPRQLVSTISRRVSPMGRATSRRKGWDTAFVAGIHDEIRRVGR